MTEEDVKLAAIAAVGLAPEATYDDGYEDGLADGRKEVLDAVEEVLRNY